MRKTHNIYNLFNLIENTETHVILEKKDSATMLDLIKIGCFNGDEQIIRLTKGTNQTCTIWDSKGSHYSWYWGDGGFTLVSDLQSKKGKLIQQAIEDEWGIMVHGSASSIRKDMARIQQKHSITHEVVYWNNGMGYGCRKDGEFLRMFKSEQEIIDLYLELGYDIIDRTKRRAEATGFMVTTMIIVK